MALQMHMFAPKSEWVPPHDLPDLTEAKRIAIDVETRDPNIKANGPGWATGDGEVVGYAIATDTWSGYIPIRHNGGGNLDEKIVNRWLKKYSSVPLIKSCTTHSTMRGGSGAWGLTSRARYLTRC